MVAVECGYSFEYIDRHMTIPRLTALNAYWKVVPPMSVSVHGIALSLGVGSEDRARKAQEEGGDVSAAKQLAAGLNAGG